MTEQTKIPPGKFKRYFELMDGIIVLCAAAMEQINSLKIDTSQIKLMQKVANFLFVKSYKTLLAIKSLCETGFIEDAGSLSRTLFENVVHLLVVTGDTTETLAQRYVDDVVVQKREFTRRRLEFPFNNTSTKTEAERLLQELDEQYQKIKGKFGIEKGEFHWSNKNLENMARDVKLGEIYYVMYAIWSWQSHAKVSSSAPYVFQTKDTLGFQALPSFDRLDEILIPVGELMIRLLGAITIIYNLDANEKIVEIENEIESLKQLRTDPRSDE